MTDDPPLSIWTVYDHPDDFPDHFVARRWEMCTAQNTAEMLPTSDVVVSTYLEAVRDAMTERYLVCLARSPSDDHHIVESWI